MKATRGSSLSSPAPVTLPFRCAGDNIEASTVCFRINMLHEYDKAPASTGPADPGAALDRRAVGPCHERTDCTPSVCNACPKPGPVGVPASNPAEVHRRSGPPRLACTRSEACAAGSGKAIHSMPGWSEPEPFRGTGLCACHGEGQRCPSRSSLRITFPVSLPHAAGSPARAVTGFSRGKIPSFL